VGDHALNEADAVAAEDAQVLACGQIDPGGRVEGGAVGGQIHSSLYRGFAARSLHVKSFGVVNKTSSNALSLMLVTALAESLLAVYQWMELLLVRSGGTATCAINETVNCATVWNSDFASRVHGLLGMPVAGLGLVWGLTAFGVSVVIARKLIAGDDAAGPIAAAKVWAALGALSCITFGVASVKLGAVCLTCLGTYALTIGFALPVLLLLPKPPSLTPALGWLAAIAVPVFVVLLWPGSLTPKGTATPLKEASKTDEAETMKYFASLPWAEAKATADARDAYLKAASPDASGYQTREVYGPANAPVKLVEFTDILCGHCRALIANLEQLKKAVPAANFSIEPRYFPLDSECNKKVTQSSGDGVRCLGAKAQICLEGNEKFWELRSELFENQQGLSKQKIYEIATKGMPLDKLQACIDSKVTQARIDEDVAYAMLFELQGTPLVLLNGREAPPVPAFLYGMMLSKGDPKSKYFEKLQLDPK